MEARRKEQLSLKTKPLVTERSKELVIKKNTRSTISSKNKSKRISPSKKNESKDAMSKSTLPKLRASNKDNKFLKHFAVQKNIYSKLVETSKDIELRTICTFKPKINNKSMISTPNNKYIGSDLLNSKTKNEKNKQKKIPISKSIIKVYNINTEIGRAHV